MSIREYKREHVAFFATGGCSTIICRIPQCLRTVVWDKSKLRVHFETQHPHIDLEAYFRHFVQQQPVCMSRLGLHSLLVVLL